MMEIIEDATHQPTNYYVSAAGNDTNNGKTQATSWRHHPWQTTATGVAATMVLNPGDAIYFNYGDTFPGGIVPKQSGVAGRSIILDAYGNSALGLPIVDGSASSAFYNHWSGTIQHYISCLNIDFSGATNTNTRPVVAAYGHDEYFYNCHIHGSTAVGASGFAASGNPSDGLYNYNVIVDHCQVYNNYDNGIYIGSDLGTYGPHDCEIRYCDVHDNGTSNPAAHGIYVRHGVDVHHNRSWNNPIAGIKCNSQDVISTFKPRVWDNEVWNNHDGLFVTNNGSKWWNNYSHDNISTNIAYDCSPTDTISTEVYFNTFVNATGYGVTFLGTVPGGLTNTFKDNLIIQDSAVVPGRLLLKVNDDTLAHASASVDFNSNIYYYNANPSSTAFEDNVGDYTFAQWKATRSGNDSSSSLITVVPDMVARYTNIAPIDGGNLSGLGVTLAGYTVDYNGYPLTSPPTPGCNLPALNISGNITDGVNPVAGVTVTLGAYSATTDTSGNYKIIGIPYGTSGNLTPSMTNFTFTTTAVSAMTVSLSGQNFVGTDTSTYSISGTITDGAAAVSGVVVALGAYNATTDGSGNYTISSIPGGTVGNLIATKSATVLSPWRHAIASFHANKTGQNFTKVIYYVRHESNNFSEYNSTSTDGGHLTTAASGLLGSSYRMNCLLSDTGPMYGSLTTVYTTNIWRSAFAINPSNLTVVDSNELNVCQVYNSAYNAVIYARLYYYAATGGYQIKVTAYDDTPAAWSTAYYPISAAEHTVEMRITKATGVASADASFELMIDGVSKEIVSGKQIYTRFDKVQLVRMGVISFVNGTPTGNLYLDELVGNNQAGGPLLGV